MIQITGIRLPFDHSDAELQAAVIKKLNIPQQDLLSLSIARKSFDARRKGTIRCDYTIHADVSDEQGVLKKLANDQQVRVAPDTDYVRLTRKRKSIPYRPLVIGTGPAGLSAGLILAEAGYSPVLVDRGKPVRERTKDVYDFWKDCVLNTESNVQFGEGGAGTFSDGKLQTRVKDRANRDKKILEELVSAGAPEEILYDYKPHIGTAKLVTVIENLRKKIIGLGGEYRFQNRVEELILDRDRIRGVVLHGGEEIRSDHVILAIGHSARDTFEMLYRQGVSLEAKPFSIGLRIEHPQSLIDQNQYGQAAGHPRLGAANYQLAHHSSSGRTVYSFCMCPGGSVIAAASERGTVVTNGMSQYARLEINANSAIVAEVSPADFGRNPLDGIRFQRLWEKKAYVQGGENYYAPCQRLEDFLRGKSTKSLGTVMPSYKPGITLTNLQECLPPYVVDTLCEALPEFEKKIERFTLADALLTGVETRTSSPVRILRGKDFQSLSVRGLYPAGEGSGYAGGILSSAMDGIKAAEAMISSIQEEF